MTEGEAIEYVGTRVSYQDYPALTEAELTAIVEASLRYTTRASSTAYTVESAPVRLSASNFNGRIYQCIEAGTTDTSETTPSWPLVRFAAGGQFVQDGTVLWQDVGPCPEKNYDLKGAIKSAWLLKASKAAKDFNAQDRDLNLQTQQVYQHCLEQAARHEALWIA